MSLLSPDELLGLAGRSLEGRLRRVLQQLPQEALRDLIVHLQREAHKAGLTYEHEAVLEAIRVLPRPLCMLPEQAAFLHHASLSVLSALRRLPELYRDDPHVRRTLPLGPAEAAFLLDVLEHLPAEVAEHPLYGRLDAVCDLAAARWRDTLRFLEPNLCGVGGVHIGPTAEALVLKVVAPLLGAYDPQLKLEAPRDQRELFLQLLIDHAQALGRPSANLCLLEPKYAQEGPNEQSVLARQLGERHGVRVVHADPRELRLVGQEVLYQDTPIDVLYRDYEVRDLLRLRAEEGVDLAPLQALFRQNRVVSAIGGDLDHKSGFELLTDPIFAARHFSPEERRLFQRHVLWTRLLYPRRTSLPDGSQGDLLAFARGEREHLVLKPNRGYGGVGIVLGPQVSQGEWEAALDAALRRAADPEGGAVLQVLVDLPVYEFPVLDDAGHVAEEPFYTVMGFAPTEAGLGVLCRASQRRVVNVAQRGGVCALLIGHPPAQLRGPAPRPSAAEAARRLEKEVATLRHLDAAIDLLGWDEETYLPPGGRVERGEQLGALETLRQRLLCAPGLGDLLVAAQSQAAAGSAEAAELALLQRRRELALRVPDALVQAFAEVRSRALAAWEEARVARSFRGFAPLLEELLACSRERAAALSHGGDPYDALLDEHEPGACKDTVGPLLEALREPLLQLGQRAARPAPPAPWLQGPRYPDAAQEAACRELLAFIGFDFQRGRLDRSTHPFTLYAGSSDVRLTIAVDEANPLPAIFSALHEGGHGLYDQGFQAADRHRLLGTAPGIAMHEAQARLWENIVGRGRPLWTAFYPRLQRHFPEALGAVPLDTFLAEARRVQPGLVRIEADEVTYSLHVLLRYRLEVALLAGDLAVADLPGAWQEGMVELLGLRPPDDRLGCLQDVHWALGAFGYFPTYALGNLYAAQLYDAWLRAEPQGEEALARGDTRGLLGWLRARVHQPGYRLPSEELLRQASGAGLSAAPFLAYLQNRYE